MSKYTASRSVSTGGPTSATPSTSLRAGGPACRARRCTCVRSPHAGSVTYPSFSRTITAWRGEGPQAELLDAATGAFAATIRGAGSLRNGATFLSPAVHLLLAREMIVHLRLWLGRAPRRRAGCHRPVVGPAGQGERAAARLPGRPPRRPAQRPPGDRLLTLGTGCSVEPEVDLAGHWVDGGQLHIGAVRVGADAQVGARSTLLPGADVGAGPRWPPARPCSVPCRPVRRGRKPRRLLRAGPDDRPPNRPRLAGRLHRLGDRAVLATRSSPCSRASPSPLPHCRTATASRMP